MNTSVEKTNKEQKLPKNIYDKNMLKEKLASMKSRPNSTD